MSRNPGEILAGLPSCLSNDVAVWSLSISKIIIDILKQCHISMMSSRMRKRVRKSRRKNRV
jgi:hypothetical protein